MPLSPSATGFSIRMELGKDHRGGTVWALPLTPAVDPSESLTRRPGEPVPTPLSPPGT